MESLFKLKDDQYPHQTITHVRKTVRAIVFDNEGKIALHHIKRDDKFGHRDYFETPGGGVKKYERLIPALKRELSEELGVSVKDIHEVGKVIDYYNLIQQKNEIYYYYCYVDKIGEKHFDKGEETFIESTHYMTLDEAIKVYSQMNKEPIEILVSRRELPIVLLVKKMIESQSK